MQNNPYSRRVREIFPVFLGKVRKKGLLQNSANEKNEIGFPKKGLPISFFVVS